MLFASTYVRMAASCNFDENSWKKLQKPSNPAVEAVGFSLPLLVL